MTLRGWRVPIQSVLEHDVCVADGRTPDVRRLGTSTRPNATTAARRLTTERDATRADRPPRCATRARRIAEIPIRRPAAIPSPVISAELSTRLQDVKYPSVNPPVCFLHRAMQESRRISRGVGGIKKISQGRTSPLRGSSSPSGAAVSRRGLNPFKLVYHQDQPGGRLTLTDSATLTNWINIPAVLVAEPTATQNSPFSSPTVSLTIASTHCAYPRRDGQTELTWVAGFVA